MFIMEILYNLLIKEWDVVKNVAAKVEKMLNNASNVKGKDV